MHTIFFKRLPVFIIILGVHFLSCAQNPEKRKAIASQTNIDSLKYIPKAIGWVNDYDSLFTGEQIQSLDSIISSFEKRTSVEISVATVDSAIMGPFDLEEYSLLMLNTWGVGKKEKKNGILIVIVSDLRRLRIQNGYGIEDFLSNKETKEIIDYGFVPYFRKGEFYSGTKNGILAIIKKLDENGYK